MKPVTPHKAAIATGTLARALPPADGAEPGPVATMAPGRGTPDPAAPPRLRRLFPCE